jgi:hypothetical protein
MVGEGPGLGAEFFRSLAVLAEEPHPGHQPIASALGLGPGPPAAEHTDLFVLQLFPWASVYLGEEGLRGGEARDRIAGFWRALGGSPPEECDHVAVLLAAYGDLAAGAGEVRADHARLAFLVEHLASWLPAFLARAGELTDGFYRRWAHLTCEALAAEVRSLVATTVQPAAALRTAGPMLDPRRDGGEPFLAALLAPVRSGIVLTRDDLRRAARDLELAARPGERRWVLGTLLGQEPAAVLHWLAGESRRQAELWSLSFPAGASGLDHWLERSLRTAALLDELGQESGSLASSL